ncbi:hypothetical protein GCM10010517_20380 [Streptosporangium fragile]|uniref:Uncharacterized protein n=1 Tax=Streptosporangium fragile TaxID=46186 RepID=A0ABP6ICE7_9ACTN
MGERAVATMTASGMWLSWVRFQSSSGAYRAVCRKPRPGAPPEQNFVLDAQGLRPAAVPDAGRAYGGARAGVWETWPYMPGAGVWQI